MRAVVRADDADRLAGDGLVAVRANGVAALASVRGGPAPVTEAELREHEAIARRVHEAATSLPARFGKLFADEPALVRALREREGALDAALADVGTRVELGVTLSWRAPRAAAQAPTGSGRAFLVAAAGREQERREAEQVVVRLIGELPSERVVTRHRVCPREGVAATAAILIQRDEVDTVRAAIDSFGRRSTEVRIVQYGPMPPYSFAS